MKKLLFIFLLISSFSYAQKPHLYLGAKTLHGIHINLDLIKPDTSRFGFSFTYFFQVTDNFQLMEGGPIALASFFRGLNQKGIGIGLNYGLPSRKNSLKWHIINIEYQHLKSGNYINDEGLYGGSQYVNYSEFYDVSNLVYLAYQMRRQSKTNKRIDWFFEFGLTLNLIERQYTVQGSFANQKSSDEALIMFIPYPVAKIGINFKLF